MAREFKEKKLTTATSRRFENLSSKKPSNDTSIRNQKNIAKSSQKQGQDGVGAESISTISGACAPSEG